MLSRLLERLLLLADGHGGHGGYQDRAEINDLRKRRIIVDTRFTTTKRVI